MEDPGKFQQMQDEMSRFEAEISGGDGVSMQQLRPIIGVGTYNAVQQQLEGNLPAPPPPPGMMPPFAPPMMMPVMPPPPPPPAFMVPPQVRRLQQDRFPGPPGGRMPFMPGMPGPQLIPPPPPKPQPVVLAAAPKLYKKPKPDKEEGKNNSETPIKKKKKEKEVIVAPPPPPAPLPPRSPRPPPRHPRPRAPPRHRHHGAREAPQEGQEAEKSLRTGAGQVWEDVTLLDWPDDDFRMFCGDLGNDVTDELLIRTFSKYSSFLKAKVIRDRRTNKSKGFGFVSFKEPTDFIKAMKEMDGRYVGSRPIKLRKSTWRNRSLDVVRKKEKEKAALLSMLMAGKS